MPFDRSVPQRARLRVGTILLNTGCCDDVAIVHVRGECDQDVTAALRIEVGRAVTSGVSAVILDITHLNRLSTTAARALRELRAVTNARQVELCLASGNRTAQLSPPDVFAVHTSVVDALAALPPCSLHGADMPACSEVPDRNAHRADHGSPGHLCLATGEEQARP